MERLIIDCEECGIEMINSEVTVFKCPKCGNKMLIDFIEMMEEGNE